MGVADRLKHAWNAFLKDPTIEYQDIGPSYYRRPDRHILSRGNDRSIVSSIFNKIAMDAAALDIEHVQLDDENRYIGTIKSGLNNCLTLEANIDQTGRAFMQDVVFSMLDEGAVAIVPTDTDVSPKYTSGFDILTLRTAKILEWFPQYVKLRLYNEKTGKDEEITLPKKMVAIIENPLYATVNEPNSTLQRLMRKLVLIDAVDEETGSGKLNMIIQLPYIIKTESRRQQAENRRRDIEEQLRSSKYGVAYADGTEKIMQLNRPLENNLLAQIEYLTSMLYGQLGITDAVMNGTASEEEMQNYYSRTIEPILSAITDEMKRKFITKNARTRGQSIKYFRDPFKLITVSSIAEIGDTLTRNEIMTSNEFRQILGLKPSDSPRADELVNKNMPVEDLGIQNGQEIPIDPDPQGDYNTMVGDLDSFDDQLDALEESLNHSELMHRNYASPYYDPEKAHEYYMKNRELKGRSTSGLNEEGKFTAKSIKEALDKERDEKIQTHRDTTDSKISDSRKNMTNSIENMRKTTNSAIESNTEQMNNQIQIERNNVKRTIKEHSDQMNRQIKQLQNQLSNMGPNQRKKRRQEFQDKIDELRAENDSQREELQTAYSEFSSNAKSKNAKDNSKLREEQKEHSTKKREEHAEEKGKLSKEHKDEKKKLKEEYEDRYGEELAKLFENPSLLKEVKAKGGKSGKGSSKKSSSSNTRKLSSYKGSGSKVAAIRKKYGV